MSEARIQADILVRWGAHPCVRLWRSNAGKGWLPTNGGTGWRPVQMNPTGSTDLTGVVRAPDGRGLFLGIEVKRPDGRPSEAQLRWREMLRSLGAIHILAKSVADVDAVLVPLLERGAA